MWFSEIPVSEFQDNLSKNELKETLNEMSLQLNVFLRQNCADLNQISRDTLNKKAELHRVLEALYSGVSFEIITDQTWNSNDNLVLTIQENTFRINETGFYLKTPEAKDENSYHRDTVCELFPKQALSHFPFGLRLIQKDIQKQNRIATQVKLQLPKKQSDIQVGYFSTLLEQIPVDCRNLLDSRPISFVPQDFQRKRVDFKEFDVFKNQHSGIVVPAVPSRSMVTKLSKHPEHLTDEYMVDDQQAPEPEAAIFWDSFQNFLRKMENKTQSLKNIIKERFEKDQQQSNEPPETQELLAIGIDVNCQCDPNEITEITVGDSKISNCVVFTIPYNPGYGNAYVNALKQFIEDNNLSFDQFDTLMSTIEQLRYRAGNLITNKNFADVQTGIDNGVIALITTELQKQLVLEPLLKVFICFVQNLMIGVRWSYLQALIEQMRLILEPVQDIKQFKYILDPKNCVFPSLSYQMEAELPWYETRKGVLELMFGIIGPRHLQSVKSVIQTMLMKK